MVRNVKKSTASLIGMDTHFIGKKVVVRVYVHNKNRRMERECSIFHPRSLSLSLGKLEPEFVFSFLLSFGESRSEKEK
jgi:hypothetical protein